MGQLHCWMHCTDTDCGKGNASVDRQGRGLSSFVCAHVTTRSTLSKPCALSKPAWLSALSEPGMHRMMALSHKHAFPHRVMLSTDVPGSRRWMISLGLLIQWRPSASNCEIISTWWRRRHPMSRTMGILLSVLNDRLRLAEDDGSKQITGMNER